MIMPTLVAGGAATFKTNAETYLNGQPSILSAPGGIEGDINDFVWQQNAGDQNLKDRLQCTPKAASYADIEVWSGAALCAGAHEIRIVASGSDVGVRYLPYQADKLSYMKLDAAARWVFTGPIEGCFVYVVTHGGNTYLFHVNANAVSDSVANATIKDKKLRAAVDALLPGGVISHRLSRDNYFPPADDKRAFRGFVYGKNTGAGWEFRYHSFTMNGATVVPLYKSPLLPDGSGMLA
jgi:hypothetical protein